MTSTEVWPARDERSTALFNVSFLVLLASVAAAVGWARQRHRETRAAKTTWICLALLAQTRSIAFAATTGIVLPLLALIFCWINRRRDGGASGLLFVGAALLTLVALPLIPLAWLTTTRQKPVAGDVGPVTPTGARAVA